MKCSTFVAAIAVVVTGSSGYAQTPTVDHQHLFSPAPAKVRADNDWTSQQVAQYPDRLIGFCGLNPLKDYALDELARCAKDPNLRRGLKLQIFLNELVPAAPDVVIQIAHLAGAGGPGDQSALQALDVFADAVAKRDPRTRQLWFDVTGIGSIPQLTADEASFFAAKIRQLGVQRIVYGSDAAAGGNPAPREAWAAFRKLPLSEEEIRTIAGNIAPYMR